MARARRVSQTQSLFTGISEANAAMQHKKNVAIFVDACLAVVMVTATAAKMFALGEAETGEMVWGTVLPTVGCHADHTDVRTFSVSKIGGLRSTIILRHR